MKVQIPEDFEPEKVNPLKEDDRPHMMYWIYPTGKKYESATPEEVHEWLEELNEDSDLNDKFVLELATAKKLLLDIAIAKAVSSSRGLFGGPEYWESLPDWQRPDKLFKRKKDK